MLGVRGITRRYDDRTVLDDVSFDVRPGRLTGFVGANGAGKTTTMRIVVGVLAPSAGEVLWDGEPIDVGTRRRFGYMPEERGLYPTMRVREQLVFFGRLHGLGRAAADARARHLLGRLGLAERADDPLESLSLGNQQRVQVAAALVHRPVALVLDEPFSGLDPLAVDAMVALLHEEVGPDVPVLFSSHQLDLVERLCDDLVVLAEGRLVASGPVEELRGREGDLARLTSTGDAAWVHGVPGVHVVEVDGSTAVLDLRGSPPEEVLPRLLAAGPVAGFDRLRRPLAQVFREVVR